MEDLLMDMLESGEASRDSRTQRFLYNFFEIRRNAEPPESRDRFVRYRAHGSLGNARDAACWILEDLREDVVTGVGAESLHLVGDAVCTFREIVRDVREYLINLVAVADEGGFASPYDCHPDVLWEAVSAELGIYGYLRRLPSLCGASSATFEEVKRTSLRWISHLLPMLLLHPNASAWRGEELKKRTASLRNLMRAGGLNDK